MTVINLVKHSTTVVYFSLSDFQKIKMIRPHPLPRTDSVLLYTVTKIIMKIQNICINFVTNILIIVSFDKLN